MLLRVREACERSFGRVQARERERERERELAILVQGAYTDFEDAVVLDSSTGGLGGRPLLTVPLKGPEPASRL